MLEQTNSLGRSERPLHGGQSRQLGISTGFTRLVTPLHLVSLSLTIAGFCIPGCKPADSPASSTANTSEQPAEPTLSTVENGLKESDPDNAAQNVAPSDADKVETSAPVQKPESSAAPESPETNSTSDEPAPESDQSPKEEVTQSSSIVPPSRAYLPPNRNTAPPPPLPAPKSEKELAEDKKAREAAKKRGEITFDDLVFEMEKGGVFEKEMLNDENWDLNEKNWKLRGFILPTTLFSQTGITEFVLVRDNQECCFGPGAALYDCVIVTMAPGKSISYTTRVVTVKGKLEIDTESFQYPDDEGHYAIYKMTAEEVK